MPFVPEWPAPGPMRGVAGGILNVHLSAHALERPINITGRVRWDKDPLVVHGE